MSPLLEMSRYLCYKRRKLGMGIFFGRTRAPGFSRSNSQNGIVFEGVAREAVKQLVHFFGRWRLIVVNPPPE